MAECSLAALVDEVRAWTSKLASNCSEVVKSLEDVGSNDEGTRELLRKRCGAVATSMTQVVAFCQQAQKAAVNAKEGGTTVATMNGHVVATIALTKGLIKIAKDALAKKNTALESGKLQEAKSILCDLHDNCSKIVHIATEVGSKSPRNGKREAGNGLSRSASPRSSPSPSPRGGNSLEDSRLLIGAIKEVMGHKEKLTRAIHTRDAVEFVSKAKELVTSFSVLKKITLKHPVVSAEYGTDRLSALISGYVKAAKMHFQNPTDAALHRTYDKASLVLANMLKDMVALVKNNRSSGVLPKGGSTTSVIPVATVNTTTVKTFTRRATISGGAVLTISREKPTVTEGPSTRRVDSINVADPDREVGKQTSLTSAIDENIADMIAIQLEEEERKAEMEAKKRKDQKEKKEQKKKKEEDKRALENKSSSAPDGLLSPKRNSSEENSAITENSSSKDTPSSETSEALAEAEAIAAIEAGFEEAEKNVVAPAFLLSPCDPNTGRVTGKSESEREVDYLLAKMQEIDGQESTLGTSSEEENAKVEALLEETEYVSTPGGESTEAAISEDITNFALDKGKTSSDIAVDILAEIFPTLKDSFKSSARAQAAKDLIDDKILLHETLRRSVTVTGRGGEEGRAFSKAMSVVTVSIFSFLNGLSSSSRVSDARREQAVHAARSGVLRTLLVVFDTIGDHAKDTVSAELHSSSMDRLQKLVVGGLEKGFPAADHHVLNACRVHTVGLIESQLREQLYDLTKGLHNMSIGLLQTMKIVFSGAMVESNAWVEFCAVSSTLVSKVEEVLGCTATLAEVIKQKNSNFANVKSAEEIDVEDLININIWNEEASPPNSKGGKIKLGTLNQLVSYLTSDQKIDNAFLRTFVCTYRSFSTPVQLLEKLQERFAVPSSLAAREEAIQLRVCVTLKYWVQNQFPDFDDALIVRLFAFINQVEDAGHSAMAEGIRQQLKEKMEERASQMHSRGNLLPRPMVISSRRTLVTDYLERHSPLEVAKQLTLIDFSIFSLIRPAELMNQAWTSKKLSHRALHVCTFMNRVNALSNWVATLVLSRQTLAGRVKTMQFLIEVAVHLRAMNNFHSLMGIVAGSNVSAVSRLKHTKDSLGKDVTKKMIALEQLMHPSGSFKHYRKQLAASKYPIIPYLGVYLTDLVFIEDGNPDECDGFINFEKRQLAFAPVQAVQTAQGEGYMYPKCEPLYSMLLHLCVLDDEMQWKLSQLAEPRNTQLKDIK